MMIRTMKFSSMLLCLTLCAACSSDSDEPVGQPAAKSYPLAIEVTENPLIADGEESANSNRAAITTTSTLSSFKLDYVYNTSTYSDPSLSASKTAAGEWTTEGTWPYTEETVNWYAYSDGTFNLTEDSNKDPYISFQADENSSATKDLLVSTASGTYSGTNGKLTFAFDHATAALLIQVKKASNISSNTLTITSMRICNIIKVGKYFFGTSSWELQTERTSYTVYSGTAKTIGDSFVTLMDGDAPYIFVIPQTLTEWDLTTAIADATTQSYIELECSIDGGASQTAYIPFGATFVKGKKHDVKINIGKYSLYSGPDTKVITN